MIIENLKIRGDLTITLIDGTTNEVKLEKQERNLVVTVGRNWIASRFADSGIPTQMGFMEIGQGTTAAAATDTTIQTPFSPQARVALAIAGGTVSGNVITYSATFPAGTGTGAVTEAAIFNNATIGTMLCRTTFGVVNKAAGDVLAINWSISVLSS